MKDALLRLLANLGLLRPAYRAYETARGVRRAGARAAPDGLPIPPSRLIYRVAGTTDVDWFLESGRVGAETIADSLARNGVPLAALPALLDFGCGCGRVTRYWHTLERTLVCGTDYKGDAVKWCRRNLPFARFEQNALVPPLPYPERQFDFAYALSVFTHLPQPLQVAWMAELGRVLKPRGYLLATTHGEAYLGRLTGEERARFARGELVVRWQDAAGTNLCTAFHPRRYVEGELARGFDVLEFVPEGAKGNPHQDLVLLRKPAG